MSQDHSPASILRLLSRDRVCGGENSRRHSLIERTLLDLLSDADDSRERTSSEARRPGGRGRGLEEIIHENNPEKDGRAGKDGRRIT